MELKMTSRSDVCAMPPSCHRLASVTLDAQDNSRHARQAPDRWTSTRRLQAIEKRWAEGPPKMYWAHIGHLKCTVLTLHSINITNSR